MSNESLEASNTPFGSFKISSANLNTLLTLFSFVLICVISWALWAHTTEAAEARKDNKETGKLVAQELKEANREVAGALRESNREVSKVLQELSKQIRIQNCISSIPQTVTPQQRTLLTESCRINQ